MNLAQMKQARLDALQAANDIHAKAKADGGRDLTPEEFAQAKAHVEKANELKAKIAELEAVQNQGNEIEAEIKALSASAGTRSLQNETSDATVRERVMDDPKGGFANMGEYSISVARASDPTNRFRADERLRILAAATGDNQAVGSEGGFLVPPSFSTQIWNGLSLGDVNNLMSMCDTYTVEGESLTFPANAETSRATGSRYGAVQGYWIAEAQQITNSKPKFRQVKIEPFQLAVLIYATDKLLRNSPVALDQYISKAATDEINFLIGDSIINGDGVGKPKGILTGTAGNVGVPRVAVAKETGQATKTIVKENIDKMYARMHPRSINSAVWLANIDTLPQLQQLSQVVGVGGVPVFLPPGNNIASAPNGTLYGRPIKFIEYAATLGTEGDLMFVDLKSYVLGTMGGIQSALSIHLRFDYAETAFRFMFAADGQPWVASPLTPYKGANTLSPFVTLATR